MCIGSQRKISTTTNIDIFTLKVKVRPTRKRYETHLKKTMK